MGGEAWDAGGEFRIIAPGTGTTRAALVVLAVVTSTGALFTVIFVATAVGGRGLATSATVLVVGALGLLSLWLGSVNVRLLIGQRAVGYRGVFGQPRTWSRGEIDRVINMAIHNTRTSLPQPAIYFFGPDGRKLLVLPTISWKPADLNDFVEATGVPLETRNTPVPVKEASLEFPHAFGWGARHVMIATSISMLGAVALVLVGYALVSKFVLK
jgi:hypothetical protein